MSAGDVCEILNRISKAGLKKETLEQNSERCMRSLILG